MLFEHIALNIRYPLDVCNWYVMNLGMKIIRQQNEAPFITFLGDSAGRICLEIYFNNREQIINFWDISPFQMHIAFAVDSLDELKEKLIEKNVILEVEKQDEMGRLCIFRDPWGIPIQFVERKVKLIVEPTITSFS